MLAVRYPWHVYIPALQYLIVQPQAGQSARLSEAFEFLSARQVHVHVRIDVLRILESHSVLVPLLHVTLQHPKCLQ